MNAELTQGMSTLEIWIVMFAVLASKRELQRLALFFQEFAESAKEKP